MNYLSARREFYSHPYCQMMPNAISFHAWLQQLGPYPIPVRGAGGPLATEMPFTCWLETAGRETVDPLVRGCFEAQVLEERMHGSMGEYQVLKYANTSELQAMCRWSTRMALELMTRWGQEFHGWLLQGDSRLRKPASTTGPIGEEVVRMREPLKIVKKLCIECGVCREVCPYTAVYLEPTRWRVNFIIDPDRCTGCGGSERAMCVRFCPSAGAIVADTEFAARKASLSP